ncbi:MAG: protein kinase [Deltaproteobacteria bacterium]|nr:protein kinase [Deltaproteobacteria bacterium]
MTDQTAGTVSPDVPEIASGSMLAFRFTLRTRQGIHGGVETYDAFGDAGFGDVTVRLVRPAAAGRDGGFLALRLADQAENLRGLVHPGLPRLVADGWDEPLGARFLALEPAAGEKLETRLSRARKLAVDPALRVFDALCDVVAFLHDHGQVHLDLSPARVVLCPDGSPFPLKLLDAGRYRAGDSPAPPGTTETDLGCFAPERLRNEPCDARTDVHGLGAVLYRMLGGHAPFRGTTVAEVLAHRARGVAPLFAAGVSPADEADRAARRCLADDPGRRFATVADLRAELAALLARTTP